MTTRNIAAGLSAIALLAACGSESGASEPGSADIGETVTRSYDETGFTGLAVGGAIDTRVSEGAEFAITATGPEKALDAIEFVRDGGVLKVRPKKDRTSRAFWNEIWGGDDGAVRDIRLSVTMPMIDRASVGGSGDMTVDAPTGRSFDGAVAGSGNLTLQRVASDSAKFAVAGSGTLTANNVRSANTSISIAGSGSVAAAGIAGETEIDIAGSGDVAARELVASDLAISIAGSGDIAAGATGRARVNIAGSGDVDITGTTDCTVKKAGSGNVRCHAD